MMMMMMMSNVDAVYKKINSRLYFVRQLKYLRVESNIIDMFYHAIVQSIISFSITCWYGNCTNNSKSCRKLGVNVTSLLDIYKKCTIQRYKAILNDVKHPLHSCYEILPSGKRLRSAKC